MPTSIRAATPDDCHLLVEMITDLARYERAEQSVKVTAADLRQQLSDPDPPFQCAIAEVDGQPSGFALYFYTYSTWEGGSTLYLEDLYVCPQFRGYGVGAALMSFLAKTACQRRCKRFEWSVLDWNEPAIGFYRRIGAEPVTGWTRYRMNKPAIKTLAEGRAEICL